MSHSQQRRSNSVRGAHLLMPGCQCSRESGRQAAGPTAGYPLIAARALLLRGVDKKLACALEINGCAPRRAERREIPVDWPHRMSPTDCRALENSCEALDLVVPPPKHWFAGAATSDWLK